MKKLLVVLLLGLAWVGMAEAAGPVKGAKGSVSIYGLTSAVGVSTGAAVLYSVALSTGTAGTDYVVLFDSGSVTGLSAGLQASGGYKMRINVSSSTQNTFVVFDPPLQFQNGIMAANSGAQLTTVLTYERGRVVQGY